MVCVHLIDNLGRGPEDSEDITPALAEALGRLITENTSFENRDGTYQPGEMEKLRGNKTAETLRSRLPGGALVYLTDRSGTLAGCGMVVRKEGWYEAKTLHIPRDFRRWGYAGLICHIREAVLLRHGETELLIESLKFEKTLRFHRSRGFYPFDDGKVRVRSVLMKKTLSCVSPPLEYPRVKTREC